MKRLIRSIFFLLFILVTFATSSTTYAGNNIAVYINDEKVHFNTPPIIKNNRLLTPVRETFENLGYTVSWDESSKIITGTKNNLIVSMEIGTTLAFKNNVPIRLDTPPELINSKAMVPIRFVAESTGKKVNWDKNTNTVKIGSSNPEPKTNSISDSVVRINSKGIAGSGVIISSNGLIATNFHVIKASDGISITFNDGTTYTGNIVVAGYDVPNDLAILKIDSKNLHAAQLGSLSSISKGETVTTIGSPQSNLNQVTTGKILGFNSNVISTDAKTSNGSSGGGLFNSSNQLIGITVAYDDKNNHFSIPVDILKKVSTDGNYLLKDIENMHIPAYMVTNIKATYSGSNAYLSWNNIYSADYFYIYTSSEINGEYIQLKNPKTNTNAWYWGYPNCFGITVEDKYNEFYKIASVKNGVVSQLSEPVEIKLGY